MNLQYTPPNGAGNVIGPASAVDENIAVFNLTTGKIIKDGGNKIADLAPKTSPTFATSITGSYLTASEILITDGDKKIVSAPVATYPSLTELSYVKGLSSAVQTQLNAKAATLSGTQNEIAYFNTTSTIASLAVATYPSLTELSYVKGVTSAIQTQLGTKITASSTDTLTNKRITARVSTEASSATPTINTDNVDAHSITALATAITSMTTNLSGTPTNFQKLIIRILDDGTGRAIAWGASFEDNGQALPTTTTANKLLTVGFIYDTASSKWGCVAVADET